MRLYGMELYKLLHRKMILTGLLIITGLMVLYFWFVEVGGEKAVVDGCVYTGLEGVQINRKITEEFEGTITNEKINEMIERYGLPSKLEKDMPGWQDSNYLNDFVTRFFTNGSWETDTVPTKRYNLDETELKKVYDSAGMKAELAYTTGWKVLVHMLQLGFVLVSVFVIYGISVIFAEEGQLKMLPLIFTTEEGRRRDVHAKILAAFTVTILSFIGIFLLSFFLCGMVYGFHGFHNIAGMVLSKGLLYSVYRIPFAQYLSLVSVFGLQSLLSLCAMTVCVSAYLNNSFGAVVIAAVCWGFPVLLRIFFGGVLWLFVDSMPAFLIMPELLIDVHEIWYLPLGINICMSVICLQKGTRYYKTKQMA